MMNRYSLYPPEIALALYEAEMEEVTNVCPRCGGEFTEDQFHGDLCSNCSFDILTPHVQDLMLESMIEEERQMSLSDYGILL